MNLSFTEENYIKSIFHFQQENDLVNTSDLAGNLQTSSASVTDMLKKLKQKKLINYQPYKGFTLTPSGEKIALQVIRRHRLWEYFLVNTLEFGWHEVHEIAEELEHIKNNKLIDKLDAFLGHPKFDPHGDPIPGPKGEIHYKAPILLTEIEVKETVFFTGLKNQSLELLKLMDHLKLEIGARLKVIRKFDYDNSLEIKMKDNRSITLSEQVAKNILVGHEKI